MVAIIPWFVNGSSTGCRPCLLISDSARGGDMMIENEGDGEAHVFTAVGTLWDVVPWRQHNFGATIVT